MCSVKCDEMLFHYDMPLDIIFYLQTVTLFLECDIAHIFPEILRDLLVACTWDGRYQESMWCTYKT